MCEWFDETMRRSARQAGEERAGREHARDLPARQRLDPGPELAELRPEVEALAVRRRAAHADHHQVAGAREAGANRTDSRSSIDLAPTILARGRGEADERRCRASTCSTRTAVASRDAVFGEIFEHNAVDIHKPAANLQYRWVIDGDWKLIVPHAPNVKAASRSLRPVEKDEPRGEDRTLASRSNLETSTEADDRRLDALVEHR